MEDIQNIIDETLLLRSAIAVSRNHLSLWLQPEGMPADRCLDELLTVIFHPAIDASAAAEPAEPSRLEMLRQAVRNARKVLLRHFGEEPDLDGEACLNEMLLALDNRWLVDVGSFADLFEVEVINERILAILELKSVGRRGRLPTFH